MALLPKTKTKRRIMLSEQTVLLYGMPKAGKSSFCAQVEDVIFLATEPGLNHLDVFQLPINDWPTFLSAAAELEKGDHPFKAIAVDTVDLLHKYCTDFVCKKHNIKHPSDMSFGKGFALVSSEFQRAFTKLASLPYGLFLVSHAVEREIETRTGKYHKTMPTLPESARKILVGMTDLILYVDLETVTNQDGSVAYNRVLRTKPDKHFEAGDRTGKLPDPLPLDFKAFKDAFEQAVAQPEQKKNKEKEDTKIEKPESPEKPVSPSKPKSGASPNQRTSNTAVV